jgi:hypothetical protein
MHLDTDRPVRLDRLALAVTSFIELNYVHLPPGGSLFDADREEPREEAVDSFLTWLDDAEDDDVADVQRALAWVLNLPPDRFADVAGRLHVPFPRFDPPEIRRFLELLWERSAKDDWHVAEFEPDAYELDWGRFAR